MDFEDVTYVGSPVDDREVFDWLPRPFRRFLEQTNGLVAYGGGLHIRGAVREPAWHALRDAWAGPDAFHTLYATVAPTDIPFAEDAVGDQWILRDGSVMHLFAETGELESAHASFDDFLAAVERESIDTLGREPLMQFQADGGQLSPGQLLNVYPPFCTKESADGVSLQAVPSAEQRAFLAEFASQLPADGATFRFVVGD